PYEAPKADAEMDFEAVMRRDLRAIAIAQKAIIFCILGNFGVFALNFALRGVGLVATLIGFAFLGLVAVQIWATATIAKRLYRTGMAIFAVLGMFIPCFSLVVLLMLNGAVTKRLRAAGVHVGLLGADLAQVQ